MTEQHTPGPWHCHEVVGVYAEDGKLVASIHTPISNRSYDAELIAASPDLLNALQEMLSYTADLDPMQGFDDHDHPAVKQAIAAIAKATGETK